MSQVTVLSGAVWGFVGALTMVIVMQAIGGDDPPPFAVFWSRFVGGGNPSTAMPQALLVHAVYAVAAGAVYVVLFSSFDLGLPITGLTGGIVWGIVWAAILFVVGAVLWVNLILDMDPDPPQVAVMALAHLGYGLTLGVLGALVPHLV